MGEYFTDMDDDRQGQAQKLRRNRHLLPEVGSRQLEDLGTSLDPQLDTQQPASLDPVLPPVAACNHKEAAVYSSKPPSMFCLVRRSRSIHLTDMTSKLAVNLPPYR